MNELKQTILGDLSKLPPVLNDKATELLLLKNQLEELKFNVKINEQRLFNVIETAVDEVGKPKYSNTTKRQAATDEMLTADENHQTNLLSMGNIKVQIDNLTLQHQFCKDKFSAAKAMSRLVGD